MPSHHTAIWANSLEHRERYDIITDEDYRTPSGRDKKYIGFGLRIERGKVFVFTNRQHFRF